ncbi:MAG: response regulator transcription factor, partial [Alkalispirochaeta sp.]
NAGYGELRSAVLTVASGGLYLDQVMLRLVFAQLSHPREGEPIPEALAELTEREREVFGFLLEDKSTAEIGSLLYISVKTVENHRSSIYRKLDVHDRLSLFNFARRNGMIQ